MSDLFHADAVAQAPTPTGALTDAARPEDGTDRARRRARVLIIDDEPLVATAIRRSIMAQHDVTVVMSGHDALRRFADGESYDVVFCDVMMPELTGVELYQRMESCAPEHLPRLVFLTGGASSDSGRAFLDRPDITFIEKPFTKAELLAAITAKTC